jgi:YkoY family integral membrane protein
LCLQFVLFAIESVLSIDNAAVLAVCVNRLPEQKDRDHALTYGIVGAYLFRGASLLLVGWLLANPDWGSYIKIAGGLYLARLVWTHFTPEQDSSEEGDFSWLENAMKFLGLNKLSTFWLVVIEVEILDFTFSIDNILAVSAMSNNLYIIIAAVFLAILTMRFVTQKMSRLMDEYPYLEDRAYIVIGLIAFKLVATAILYFTPFDAVKSFVGSEMFDMVWSVVSVLLFLPTKANLKAAAEYREKKRQEELAAQQAALSNHVPSKPRRAKATA